MRFLLGRSQIHFNIGIIAVVLLLSYQFPLLLGNFLLDEFHPVLFHSVSIRGHITGDNHFTQPQDGFNGYLAGIAEYWVQSKHHSGSLRLHHLLYRDSNTNLEVVKTLLNSVEDSSCFKEGSPALLNGFHHIVFSFNVKVGALLTGKGSLGQVFSGGRRAYGYQALAHFGIAFLDFCSYFRRHL